LPQEFGSWKTVYNRYNRWVHKGHLDNILEILKNHLKPAPFPVQ
jgi:hypothetical protein